MNSVDGFIQSKMFKFYVTEQLQCKPEPINVIINDNSVDWASERKHIVEYTTNSYVEDLFLFLQLYLTWRQKFNNSILFKIHELIK